MHLRYAIDNFRRSVEPPESTDAMLRALDRLLPQSVSVVGNAASLLDSQHGAEIDTRPTIRFNRARIVAVDGQGSRWDLLATSNRPTLKSLRNAEPLFRNLIFTAYLDVHLRSLFRVGAPVPVTLYPMRLSDELCRRLQARPTVGLQMLFLLDRLGRKDVHIFGFDWKDTPTFYDADRARDPHDHALERRVAGEMIARNGWQLYR